MDRLSKLFIILSCLCQLTVVSAKVVETNSMLDVEQCILGPSWILFDVDDTIMDSAHMLNSGPWVTFYWRKLPQLFPNRDNLIENLMHHVNLKIPMRSVEEVTPQLIFRLQQRNNIVVLGLTARSQVSTLNENGEMEDVTKRQLRGIGVDFSKSKYPPFLQKQASFHQGIIFTDGKLKGPVLRQIINNAPVKPKCIIFIDDLPRQAESVEQAMKAAGIPCRCLLYTRANLERPTFDAHAAVIQLKYLMMHEKLLSPSEITDLKESYPRDQLDHILREVVEHFENKHYAVQ